MLVIPIQQAYGWRDAPVLVMAGVTAVGALGWLIIDAARPLIPR